MSDTQAAYQAFLYFLSYNVNKTISAEHAGLSLADIRSHQLETPDFARAMEEAVEAAADRLRFEAWQRAVHGEDVPYFYQGVQVGTKRRRSDHLMTQLLRVLGQRAENHTSEEDSRVQLARQRADKLARLSEADAKQRPNKAD